MLREASYYSRMALGYYRLRWMPLEPDPREFIRRSLALGECRNQDKQECSSKVEPSWRP